MGNKQLQYIYCPISRNKDNLTMRFDRSIEYGMTIIFFKTHAENEARRLVPDLFVLF